MKLQLAAFAVFMTVQSFAQTQPIQPQTPDVKIPPKLTLPPPKEVTIGQQPLTASEAVAIALKNQPLIGIANGNLTSAQGRTEQAASGLLPHFSASGQYSNSSVFRGASSGSPQTGGAFSSSAGVTQLLFDFGRTRDSLRQSEAGERSVSRTLSRTQQTVALNVRQAFYTLSQAIADEANSDANVSNRQRQLDEAQARLSSGLGAPGDLVSAKTSLASAVLSLSSARDTTLTSKVLLAQLMGVDPRTPITPAASSEAKLEAEADLQRLVVSAMNDRPDIRAAEENVTSARYGVSFAQKGNFPQISAGSNVDARGTTNPFTTESGAFSINVTWSFSDGGLTAGAIKEAKGNEESARQALIQVTQQAVADVSQAYLDLQSAVQRVDLANVEVANAAEFVRIAEGRYTGGIGLFADVTTAQAALVGAQHDQTQAQADVERARASLRAAIGLQ